MYHWRVKICLTTPHGLIKTRVGIYISVPRFLQLTLILTDPERGGLRCVQGFVNLLPNGSEDGGLLVMKGAHKLSEEYHDVFRNEERGFRWTNEIYMYKDTGLKWLADRGCEWIKVNAEPGDLVLCEYHSNSPSSLTQLTCRLCQGTHARHTTMPLPPGPQTDWLSMSV